VQASFDKVSSAKATFMEDWFNATDSKAGLSRISLWDVGIYLKRLVSRECAEDGVFEKGGGLNGPFWSYQPCSPCKDWSNATDLKAGLSMMFSERVCQ
jgi:hypothetical protein